jgi:hypothetical protein
MTFPWLIGRLLDVGGPVVVPATTAILLAAASVAAWVFLRRQPDTGRREPPRLAGERALALSELHA